MAQSDYQKLTPSQLTRLGYSATSERYIPVGANMAKKNTVSRRAYDDMSDRYKGFGSRAHYEARYSKPRYHYFMSRLAKDQGKRIREIDGPRNKDSILAYKASGLKGRAARNPNGSLAKMLVQLGFRKPEWTFDVGDTPPGMSHPSSVHYG